MSQRQTQGRPVQGQGQRTNASGRVGGRNRTARDVQDIESMTPFTGAADAATSTQSARRRARAAAAAQAQTAQQRRRLLLVGGGSTALVVAIVAVVLLLTHPWQSDGMVNLNNLAAPSTMASTYSTISKVGTTAPDFTLSTVDGHQYTLSSLRGHPVILEFFAVWCPHCQAMAPIINNVEKQYANKGVRALSVLASPYGRNFDISYQQDTSLVTKDDVNWFANNFNVKHPILIDPSFSATNQYGAGSYPTMYVLDRNGVIRYSSQGEFAQKTLADAVAKVS